MSATVLGFLALALAGQAGWVWARSIGEVRTGERRPLVLGIFLAAIGLGVVALWQGPGLFGGIAAGLAVAVGTVFLTLTVLGRQLRAEPAVAVGKPMVDFTAPDAEGQPFALASLAGRPYLLKLFRGHW
ncbi:MAG: hypothetical protein ABFS41_16625 [Myxococcota bacterium]